jgi:hypothetical protein
MHISFATADAFARQSIAIHRAESFRSQGFIAVKTMQAACVALQIHSASVQAEELIRSWDAEGRMLLESCVELFGGKLGGASRQVSFRVSLRWQTPKTEANGRKPTKELANAKLLALCRLREKPPSSLAFHVS